MVEDQSEEELAWLRKCKTELESEVARLRAGIRQAVTECYERQGRRTIGQHLEDVLDGS